ncbi:ABC transporter substrate-binding protein [Blastochloris viridis]|uniref:ABC transporter substrate-binding protein n=1 Tax=Blastochloris viridis TaxID=1079 RepID=UPI000764ABC4|nr:extracellular solute-binding protein [Blastochloris viridis]
MSRLRGRWLQVNGTLGGARRAVSVAAALILGGVVLASPAASKDTVVVLTTYHDDVVGPVVKAFETAHPDIAVELVWKQGIEAFGDLSKPDQSGIDVFWGPSLSTFPALRDRGAFRAITVDRASIPGRIGRQQISDPNGLFEAYEVAGYGLAFNLDRLKERGLGVPKAWRDLATPRVAGAVGLPIPASVGFSPALYDVILQSEGWERGWALISEIAGNGKLLGIGGSPTDLVAAGDIAVGLTIDFYPMAAAASGRPVGFVYPARTAFLPAHIATTASAPNAKAAATFVAFLLSRPAQELLLRPDIRRHPIRPDAYGKIDAVFANPFAPADDITFAYDADLGRLRRGVISALFDAAITSRHQRVAALWRAIHDAEAKLAAQPNPKYSELLAEARRLAGSVPVSAEAATDPARLARIKSYPSDIAAVWNAELDRAHERAFALVRRVGADF